MKKTAEINKSEYIFPQELLSQPQVSQLLQGQKMSGVGGGEWGRRAGGGGKNGKPRKKRGDGFGNITITDSGS